MKTPNALALLTLILLAAYHVSRYAATRCSGSGCDSIYIPISLLLPFLTWLVAVATGLFAILDARQTTPIHRAMWLRVLSICTLLVAAVPVISLVVFRDSPDQFVLVATVFVAISPIATLAYGAPRHP